MSEEKKFYVYVHKYASGPKEGQVFYVGKGSGNRAWSTHSRNPHWVNVVAKYGFTAAVSLRFTRELCAFSFECALISLYERSNLVNMTDGGDGPSGYTATDAAKMAISENMVKNWADPEYRTSMMARYNSAEVKSKKSKSIRISQKRPSVVRKLSESATEQWNNKEVARKMALSMSAAKGGRPFRNDAGVVFDIHSDAIKWLNDKGWPKASQGNLCMALNGQRRTAYGYKWEYIK